MAVFVSGGNDCIGIIGGKSAVDVFFAVFGSIGKGGRGCSSLDSLIPDRFDPCASCEIQKNGILIVDTGIQKAD